MGKRSGPWPNKNDNPFKKGSYGPTQANLDWFEFWDFPKDLIILEGFKEAADKIVDDLQTGRRGVHADKFFFPVVYLYRHAFELCLKCIIREGIDIGFVIETDSVKRLLNKSHNLHKLWNKARCVLVKRWPAGDRDTLTNVERGILQFHKVDPLGQATRYARDGKGNPHLENAPKVVDLVNLKKVVSNLYTFLNGCSQGLDEDRLR